MEKIRCRAQLYIFALALVLTGSSLADPAGRDTPGVGTFTYCGTPLRPPRGWSPLSASELLLGQWPKTGACLADLRCRAPSVQNSPSIEIIEIFCVIVSSGDVDETILPCDETIFRFSRRYPETAAGYQTANENGGNAGSGTGGSQMRTISFILAFAFVMAGPSIAGSPDIGPGIGTFNYNGSPIVPLAPQTIVVAAN